ncbi:hypothetical protein BH23GEM3_BH23GEM3_05060 [soil metagenome]
MELFTLQVRLIVCSIDKAEQIGLTWWKTDPGLAGNQVAVPGETETPLAGLTKQDPNSVWRIEGMGVERTPGGSSLIDVLDRVLDKGIVIDAHVRVSRVGIDLVTVDARIVVASIETYLKYPEAVGISSSTARPRELTPPSTMQTELDRLLAENAELRRRLNALS